MLDLRVCSFPYFIFFLSIYLVPFLPSLIPSSVQSDLSSILFAHPSGGETKWTGALAGGRTDGRGRMMGTDANGGGVADGPRGTRRDRHAHTEGWTGQTTQTLPHRPKSPDLDRDVCLFCRD